MNMELSHIVSVGLVWISFCAGALLSGCRSPSNTDLPLEARLIQGETIVKDGSHGGSMLLYDGHLVGGLQDRKEVEETVGVLTPEGTYSVMIDDDEQRIFNVDSLTRLAAYMQGIEGIQGALDPGVTFTIRSRDGRVGRAVGQDALMEFFKTRYPGQLLPRESAEGDMAD